MAEAVNDVGAADDGDLDDKVDEGEEEVVVAGPFGMMGYVVEGINDGGRSSSEFMRDPFSDTHELDILLLLPSQDISLLLLT